MTDLRQAAQALLNRWDSPLWKNGSTAAAIADLRAALGQQQAEPVAAESITDAMMNLVDRLGSEWKQVDLRAWQHLLVYAPQQQAEPVAWMTHSHDLLPLFHRTERAALVWGAEPTPLYTTPPQRKPLTDEMRKQMKEASDSIEMRGAFANGWLSAEAAHGIKEGT